MGEGLAGASILVTLFLVLLAILWIVLPFAVFGIKTRLGELLEEQRRTNGLLSDLQGQMAQRDNDRPR